MKKPFVISLILATTTCIFDQFSKYWVLEKMLLSSHEATEITTFFNLALVWNRGISFGMFAQDNQPLLLTIISLLIVSLMMVWLYKNNSLMVSIGIGVTIGGAIGNIIDRMRFGAVVDFLDFHLAHIHWPAFNIADSAIFIGVVVLCTHSMFFEKKNHPQD